MFTGIIREVGEVAGVRHEQSLRLTVKSPGLAPGLQAGDSVAVNGVCLTAESISAGSFQATVQPQTARLSTLGELAVGTRVNLEPALRLGDPLGGHLLAGHVDGVGVLTQSRREGESLLLTIRPPAELMRYLPERGSVAVDGVSLTVARTTPQDFTVSLVRYTLEQTTLAALRAGARVNLEVDLLARYVERLLQAQGEAGGGLDLSQLGEEEYF